MADALRFVAWVFIGMLVWSALEAMWYMLFRPMLYRTGVIKPKRAYHVSYMCRKCSDCGSDQVYAYGDEQSMAYCNDCGHVE